MGSPLLGKPDDSDRSNDRAYNENRCVCCWRVVVPARNPLPVCVECVGKLSPSERAAIVFAVQHSELLKSIRGSLMTMERNDENDQQQMASMAKAIENLGRLLSEFMKGGGGKGGGSTKPAKLNQWYNG